MSCLGMTLVLLSTEALGQGAGGGDAEKARGMKAAGQGPRQPAPVYNAPAVADIILGRPTASSIVLNVLRYDRDGSMAVTYGTSQTDLSSRTAAVPMRKGTPQELVIDGLKPGASYYYRLLDSTSGQSVIDGRFQTQRNKGVGFAFTITADSHLDTNTDLTLYRQTLNNVGTDAPDFHIDLGDTFMTGKHENRQNAAMQYLAQRAYLGPLSRSAPLYLVVGNHDGEEARQLRDGASSLAVWANTMRKRYFPNPLPDAFYSGNAASDPWAGMLQDYYAWNWGDVQFIVLNPYWHGSGRRTDERWELSLGDTQYRWLVRTLESSTARFKLVFVHQLIGGADRQGRGGSEAAVFGEWGGRNADGSDGFRQHRPGWAMPIHPLLVRHGVKMVFHGHDHLFAKQDLDGIVYQEVPQPGHPGRGVPSDAVAYGYRNGVILGGAGHLRVRVSSTALTVEFVRADTGNGNGQIAHAYTVPPDGSRR